MALQAFSKGSSSVQTVQQDDMPEPEFKGELSLPPLELAGPANFVQARGPVAKLRHRRALQPYCKVSVS